MRPLLLAGLLLAAGCVTPRPAVPLADLQALATEQGEAEAQARALRVERLVRRLQARGDGTLDVLVLSGGGQNGAYGAGFLRGWASRTTDPMPAFDLVGGVSTGALLSPFALVGTPEALAEASALYRDPSRVRPRFDPRVLVRASGGLLNTGALQSAIAETVSPAFAAEIRAALAEDRQLILGTTDLDLGVGRVWDVRTELGDTDEGLDRYRRLLVASSAIPGAFAPVVLDGRAHVDGGVASNLLVGLDYEDLAALAEQAQAAGVPGVRVRLWVLYNIWLRPPLQTVRDNRLQAVRGRSNGLLFFMAQQEALVRLHDLARAATGTIPALTVDLRYTAVPDAQATEPGASALFDGPFMQALETLGYERARGASPWDPLPVSLYARP